MMISFTGMYVFSCKNGQETLRPSAASDASRGSLSAAIVRAAAGGRCSFEFTVDDCGSTTDAAVHRNRSKGTVYGTGPAFHASVQIRNFRFVVLKHQNFAGTDIDANATSGAGFLVQFQ
jgi:hypothetical protein